MTDRHCVRCTARKPDGSQCTRRTCKYQGMCWQHSQLRRGLKIAPSTIPGADDGLFATQEFKKGDIVCTYAGNEHKMTVAQYNATEGPHDYGFQHRSNFVYDGRSTQSGMGRWANDCRVQNRRRRGRNGRGGRAGHCVENNTKPAVHTQNQHGHGMRMRATKNIHRGDEIFIPYHAGFWNSDDH